MCDVQVSQAICPVFALYLQPPALVYPSTKELNLLTVAFHLYLEKIVKSKPIHSVDASDVFISVKRILAQMMTLLAAKTPNGLE